MQSKYFLAIISTLFAFVRADNYLSEKPPQLTPCKSTAPDFSKCISKNLQTLFVEWKDGVPGLKSVGKLDPLFVKRINIAQDSSQALSFKMQLENMNIHGGSKITVQDYQLDTKNWKNVVKIFGPKLEFESDYKVKGHVLSLPLDSSGKAKFIAENVVLTLRMTMKLRDDGDKTFTEIESITGTIEDIKNFHMQVDNLFNGQKDLEDSANALFNENWKELFESLRPAIEQTIAKLLEDRLRKVFHYVPGNYLIEDIPKAAEFYG